MLSKDNHYICVSKHLIKRFDGDLALAVWYATLLDYSKRFNKDKNGFFRISRQLISDDLGLSRSQVRTLNAKLAKLGLLRIDSVSRGGRSFAGYKLIQK